MEIYKHIRSYIADFNLDCRHRNAYVFLFNIYNHITWCITADVPPIIKEFALKLLSGDWEKNDKI